MSNSTEQISSQQNAGSGGSPLWPWLGAAALGTAGALYLATRLIEGHFAHTFESGLGEVLRDEEDWLRDLVERT